MNGNEIYRSTERRMYSPDTDVVSGVKLKAGLNVLVLKMVHELANPWQGSVWLTDAAGQPVKGIRMTLAAPTPGSD